VGGTRCPPPSCTVTHGRPQAPRPPLAVSTRCFVLGSTAASRTVLRREGLPETTLERIADAAGVSRATIYRRGVSRDQLIDALTARAADEFRRALWPACPAPIPPGNGFDWHWRRSVPSPRSTWTCLPACSRPRRGLPPPRPGRPDRGCLRRTLRTTAARRRPGGHPAQGTTHRDRHRAVQHRRLDTSTREPATTGNPPQSAKPSSTSS
jgi:AcrR family transcriptional regulator